MRRIIALFLISFLVMTYAHAGLITVELLSEDASIDDINKAFSTIKNEFNGNIEGVNILADSILETNLADEINPAIREGDHFNAYTVSGHLPATSADLFSDISAGTSYIKSDAGKLFRQVTATTNHEYNDTLDTWVYIDINGSFQFEERSVGSAEPTKPADSLKLAKVVTDSDNITSVSDERTLTITLTTQEDFYLKGMIIHCDNTGGVISVDSGVVRHGTSLLGKASFTNLTVSTVSDWWDGNVDSGSAVFYYIGINEDGDIKFLGNNPPDTHDTDGNTDPPFYYWNDGTKKWRVVGQIKVDTSNNTLAHHQTGSKVKWDIPIEITTTISDGVWSSALACSAAIPATSKTGLFGLYSRDDNDITVGIMIRPNGSEWISTLTINDESNANAVFMNDTNGTNVQIAGQRECATDSSQQIQYFNEAGDDNTAVDVEGYIMDTLRQ